MLKKTRTNVGELKRKSILDKQFKLKLSNIYSKKLSKFNLEKQLNTIGKWKHGVIQKVRSSWRGEGGFLKSKRKWTVGGGSSISVRSLFEKKLPDFWNSKQSSFW